MKFGSFCYKKFDKMVFVAGVSMMVMHAYTKFCTADEIYGFLKSGATVIPHPKKVYKGGEDAFIVKPKMVSVADGVGGWAKRGVDPAKFSKQLMGFIGSVYDEHPDLIPKEILYRANEQTTEVGSTTVIIAIFNPKKRSIATSLLGDSSYMILKPNTQRGLAKMYRSTEQQHRFNCPYQVGTGKDNPYLSISETHYVEHNDIIVLGTDGLWDNAFDNEVMTIIDQNLEKTGNLSDPQKASQEIAKMAFAHSLDKSFRSPFEIHSEEDPKAKTYPGGKKDDITVVVSQVKLD